MRSKLIRAATFCAVFTCAAIASTLQLSAAGFTSGYTLGALQGTVTGSSHLPSLGATIELTSRDANAITREVISRGDGSFAIDQLASGSYQLQAFAADGEASLPIAVIVTGPEAVHLDVPMQQTNPSSPSPVSPAAPSAQQRGFFTRWGHAYIDDWTASSSNAAPAPEPKRRGYAAPLSSPPFPSADWPIGGTVVIGAPDYQTYPLMQAINQNKSRFKMYGWIDIGGNASTSNKGTYANNETAYDVVPNSIQLDQAVLYLERLPDTVQTDHFDWGFRLSGLYGLDYRYTTAKGVFSQQLLSGASGQKYGADPVMYYADMYFPHVAKGMDIRIGRYISLPDIEAQLAPNNYTYSHSILYTYDCYTQHGVNATVKISDHWTAQAGVSGGCEIAPWVKGAKLTGDFCAAYTWTQGSNNLYFCANSVNSAKYGYNNISAYYLTYYHKLNATWHTDTEGWYQYERDVPNVNYGGPGGYAAITGPAPITGANGAVCETTVQTHCYAPDFAIVNYVEHEFNNHHASLNIRNEFFDDLKGQRTGTKTKYSEHLVGLDLWVGSTITVRPELRLEHSYDRPAYDSPYLGSPTKTTQLTAAADFIYHF